MCSNFLLIQCIVCKIYFFILHCPISSFYSHNTRCNNSISWYLSWMLGIVLHRAKRNHMYLYVLGLMGYTYVLTYEMCECVCIWLVLNSKTSIVMMLKLKKVNNLVFYRTVCTYFKLRNVTKRAHFHQCIESWACRRGIPERCYI